MSCQVPSYERLNFNNFLDIFPAVPYSFFEVPLLILTELQFATRFPTVRLRLAIFVELLVLRVFRRVVAAG